MWLVALVEFDDMGVVAIATGYFKFNLKTYSLSENLLLYMCLTGITYEAM